MKRWLLDAAVALAAVFAPIKAALVTVVVLVVVDLITGIMAARSRKEAITSDALSRTVKKLLVYECAALCGFLAQTYLVLGVIPLCNLVTSLVGLTEMKSVLENLDQISGGNFFAALVARLSKGPPTDGSAE